MHGRKWTAQEVSFLRRHYGPRSPEPWPARRIALELGRKVHDIHGAAKRYGLHQPQQLFWTPERQARLRELWAAGESQKQIATALSCSQGTVSLAVRNLGLQRHESARAGARHWTPLQRQRKKQQHRKYCRKYLETNTLTQCRDIRWRIQALRRGWPEANSPAECDLLDYLHEHGKATGAEIGRALGKKSNWPCVMVSKLVERGLLRWTGVVRRWCREVELARPRRYVPTEE